MGASISLDGRERIGARAKEGNLNHGHWKEQFTKDGGIAGAGRIGCSDVHEDDAQCGVRSAECSLKRFNCEERVVNGAKFVAGNDNNIRVQAANKVAHSIVLAQGDQKAPGTLD